MVIGIAFGLAVAAVPDNNVVAIAFSSSKGDVVDGVINAIIVEMQLLLPTVHLVHILAAHILVVVPIHHPVHVGDGMMLMLMIRMGICNVVMAIAMVVIMAIAVVFVIAVMIK